MTLKGLNMGLVMQALRKTKILTYQLVLPIVKRFFPTSRAHYHKFP
jgi:predicted ATPase